MLLPTPPSTPWQGKSSAHNFQLLIFNFQFTCQGVAKGSWMWIIVHTAYCNYQIFNSQFSIMNYQLSFLPRGRWEILIERYRWLAHRINYFFAVDACNEIGTCMYRAKRKAPANSSEPFDRIIRAFCQEKSLCLILRLTASSHSYCRCNS